MALGIALLLIFVLYLIDKHNRWRQAAKITIWIVAIAVLGVAFLYGWFRYDSYRTEKRQAAENAAYQAKMKPIWDCESRNSQYSNAETECEKDPSIVLVPKIVSEEPIPPHPRARRVKVLTDVDLTTTELGSLVCGHATAGEIATLLSFGGYGVRVKTSDGQIGWAYAGDFEVINTKP